MPSGREFIVERVEDGTRHVLWTTYQPGTHIVLEEADHVHFLIGTPEELVKFGGPAEVNVAIPVTVEYDDEKPKPRKTTTRKTTAKKAVK